MEFFNEFGVKIKCTYETPMKRSTFQVGEGILCIAVILECIGLIVL